MAINMVTIVGYVGNDPEIKTVNNGSKVATFSVGCTEQWRDKNGQTQSKTDWVKVQTWVEWMVEVCETKITKGSPVSLVGKFASHSWEDKDGNKRTDRLVELTQRSKLMVFDKPPQGQNFNNDFSI